MQTILAELREKENYLRKSIAIVEEQLKEAPDGRLVIDHKQEHPQFYICMKERQNKYYRRKYLKKSEADLASLLAQKDYNQRLISEAKKQLSHISSAIDLLQNDQSLSLIYGNLSKIRKELVNPVIPDNELYIRLWESVSYTPGYFDKDVSTFETERGEIVRSKSEKILADKFYLMNIPYRYEYKITFQNGQSRRPDFMLLNVRTRKEFFWEHAGMMDNPSYMDDFVSKINLYETNGIIQGKNLIITYETSKIPLNMRTVDKLIKTYLL